MERFKKFVFFLISILLLLVSFAVITNYQYAIDLPFVFLSLDEYPLIGVFMPIILFYSSLIMIFLGIFGLFIVLATPVNQKYVLIKKEHSKVKIEQKALESLILAEVQQMSFIKKATVNVKVFKKHKRMVSIIKGQISSEEEVATDLNGLIHSIESTFEKMLALPKESVRLKLKLTPFKGEIKKAKNKKRVA